MGNETSVGVLGAGRRTPEGDVRRAAERVTLACRALAAAAEDLRAAHAQEATMAVDDAAVRVGAEMERVCELAEELAKLGRQLAGRSLAGAARG